MTLDVILYKPLNEGSTYQCIVPYCFLPLALPVVHFLSPTHRTQPLSFLATPTYVFLPSPLHQVRDGRNRGTATVTSQLRDRYSGVEGNFCRQLYLHEEKWLSLYMPFQRGHGTGPLEETWARPLTMTWPRTRVYSILVSGPSYTHYSSLIVDAVCFSNNSLITIKIYW